MSEEQQPQGQQPVDTAPAGTPPTDTPAADAKPAEPAAPTWQELLDKVDPKELRKHPKYAGTLGSDLQQAIARDRQEREADNTRKSRDGQIKALMNLVEGNTDYIKEHFPEVYEMHQSLKQERAHSELSSIRSKTVEELGTAIGRVLRNIPEWKELTAEDHQKIAEALQGKTDDSEVLAIYNSLMLDNIANRRVAKAIEEFKSKELPKEREAIRKELAAAGLKDQDAPDITKPKGKPNNIGAPQTPEELNIWWENHKKALYKS